MRKTLKMLAPAFILLAISGIMALLLGGTNLLTAQKISERAAGAQQQAIAKVLPAQSYETKKTTLNGTEYEYTVAKNGSEIIGYAFTVSHNGYGGTVETVIGLTPNGAVNGIEVSDVSGETPGLGQNAGKEEFRQQFKNKSGKLSVVKSGAGENEINAVTGATITSTAVTENVNTAFELFKTVKGGAQHE